MRSNLLSLQNISRQVSSTQNKLATGNKVNSAIDNPSSYYTARSLNNRANDLDALLDSMGQAVSTIKAATTALETGATFLEQAAAVATSALETNTIPAKSYFEEKVGENGAVVTTAQELKDAITTGKETIVVYGKIDLGKIDAPLMVQNNQKLVGVGYFGDFYTEVNKFSSITATSDQLIAAINLYGATLSDISVNFASSYTAHEYGAVYVSGEENIISNADITFSSSSINYTAAIWAADYNGNVTLQGRININVPSTQGFATYGNVIIDNNAVLTAKSNSAAIYGGAKIKSGAKVFVDAERLLNSYGDYSIEVENGAQLYNKQNTFATFVRGKIYQISAGVKIGLGNDFYETTSALTDIGETITIAKNNISDYMSVSQEEPFEIKWPEAKSTTEKDKADKQYAGILQQYDSIIKDSSYKGVNLLKDEKLNVRFNENGSADLNVNGKDMSSNSLGLSTVEWSNQGDIAQSLQEIASALKSIRAFTAELGNNYSIITNRQEFTENLINILTEGADKLTLADMNEESANMLSLQTRQQLAINSLSLASQASQAVLKLF